MSCASRVPLVIGIVLGAFFFLSGCTERVAAPTSFSTFNAKDGIVQCKYPSGWKQTGGRGRKFRSAGATTGTCRFQSGAAEIRLTAHMGADPFGRQWDPELGEYVSAVARAHKVNINVAEELDEIAVQTTETIKTGFGETRRSEFTYSGRFGAKMHGYLVTALRHDDEIRVICTCPEKDWETLKPAFDEVIASLAKGTPEAF